MFQMTTRPSSDATSTLPQKVTTLPSSEDTFGDTKYKIKDGCFNPTVATEISASSLQDCRQATFEASTY